MANAVAFDFVLELAGTIELPPSRGVFANAGLILFQRQSLPSDPIGVFSLTLTNVVIGSSIQLESQDGSTTFGNSVAVSSTPNFLLQAYAAGSPLNDVRIKVRKGSSAPFYRPFETLTTAIVGSQSIYVAQQQDD